jgi:CHASE2 domain-containing sensor protein
MGLSETENVHPCPAMARFANRNFILSALATIALTTLGAFFVPYSFALPRTVEYWAEDARRALMPRAEPQDSRIVVIAIDEKTISGLPYRRPVNRGLLADILETLSVSGPQAIGLYVPLTDATEPNKDQRLFDVMRSLPIPLVVATAPPDQVLTQQQLVYERNYLNGLRSGPALLGKDGWGGAVRRMVPGTTVDGVWLSSFTAKLAEVLNLGRADRRRLAYHSIPNMNTRPFLTIPAHKAIGLPAKWFADKVVLIGLDLNDRDRHRIPGGWLHSPPENRMPGVQIQAHAVSQLLDARHLPGTKELTVLLVAFALCTFGTLLALITIGPLARIGAVIATVLGFVVFSLAVFYWTRAAIPVAMPVLGCLTAFALTRAAVQRFAQGKRDYLRAGFNAVASADLARQVAQASEAVTLDGENRAVTILVARHADFAKLAEALPPDQLISVQSAYTAGIGNAVKAHGGVLQRIDADRVVALFGAPLHQGDAPSRAVRCALAIDAFAEGYRERRMTNAGRIGETLVGLHSGDALVGNFGGDAAFAYGAYGDTVEQADRLALANAELGTRICASAATAREATDVIFRPVGRLRWPGIEESIETLEPLPESQSDTSELEAYIRAFRLIQREDAIATEEIARAAAIAPKDPLCRLYSQRLSHGLPGTVIALTG